MKHFRILLPLLVLALILSGCGSTSRQPYNYAVNTKRIITVHPESRTILDGNDVYRYNIKNIWGGTRYEFTYPNGQRYFWTESKKSGEGVWSDGYTPSIYLPGDALINALKQPAPEAPGYFKDQEGNSVAGILCIAAGLLLIVFHKHGSTSDRPRRFMRFGSSGKYGVELSPEEFAAFIFVDGVFLVIVGLILCFI